MSESPSVPSFPPPEALVEALRARISDALVLALADLVAEPVLRERITEPLQSSLREHARALEDRLLRVERLAAAGQLSAGVAHELRNPLAVIETSLFILNERFASDERALRQLRRIADQLGLATAIVNDLLETVRDRPIDRAPVDLASVARDALGRVPKPSNVTVALALPPGVAVVEGDARRLGQVLVNLLSNAITALMSHQGDGARVSLSIAVDDHSASLAVEDNGAGIPDATIARLFDPLFSTRPDGTGLGLALSRRIAEAHGGTLTAENVSAGGARFTLKLPRRAP